MITFLIENVMLLLGKLVAELTLKKIFIFKLNCAYKSLSSQSPPPLFPTRGHPRSTDGGFRPQSFCVRREVLWREHAFCRPTD